MDGLASNDSSHMLAEARQAMLLQRVAQGPDALSAHQRSYGWPPRSGAEVLGRDDIGYLAPGMAADIVGYSLDSLALAGAVHDPVLVFCRPPQVDLSLINGRLRVDRGELLGVDLPALVARHNQIAARLVAD